MRSLPTVGARARTRIAALSALLAVLVLVTPAAAARADLCRAPAGTAAIEEYCQNIPAPPAHGGHGAGSSSSIPTRTAQQLASRGAGALVALGSGQRIGRRAADHTQQPADAGSPLDALGASVAHGDVAGSGLVWALLAIALALGAAAWVRFRRRPPTID